MRRFALIALIAGTATLVTVDAAITPMTRKTQSRVYQLGPDPLFAAPDSLAKLVKDAPAAVIAEIVGPGELKLEEVAVPHSTKLSVFGYATYRASIRDVVYNRLQGDAPPLSVGSEIEFTQHVGRESAEAFIAKQIPVDPGDECLLFLWHRPHGWGILAWPLQFRKSQTIQGAAEGLGQPGAMTFLGTEWLGGSVPFAFDAGVVMPDWEGLVREVRRLAEAKVP